MILLKVHHPTQPKWTCAKTHKMPLRSKNSAKGTQQAVLPKTSQGRKETSADHIKLFCNSVQAVYSSFKIFVLKVPLKSL